MSTRRTFLKQSAGLMAATLAGPTFGPDKPKLAFSTLGCPKWSFEQILNVATQNGYSGIEIRGIQGQLDLPKCPEFSSPDRIKATRDAVSGRGLRIVGLGSSAQMHIAEPAARQKQMDDARRFVDLAQVLNCPYVRVFPNDLPKEQDRAQTLDLIAAGLRELGDYAKGRNVTVLLESHGEVTQSDLLLSILRNAEHPNVGLIWDVFNMWLAAKEPPKEVYAKLKKYIRHTHLKDANVVDGKAQYVLFGQGQAPIAESLSALRNGGYNGYYSFEWEKLWHPDIAEPDVAIPDFPKAFGKYFT